MEACTSLSLSRSVSHIYLFCAIAEMAGWREVRYCREFSAKDGQNGREDYKKDRKRDDDAVAGRFSVACSHLLSLR